jgi:para-nitrobenzyl esterase
MTFPLVTTRYGILRGVQENQVEIFRGIPYAKPLQGLGRIRAPEPFPAWQGERDATVWAPAAPQEEIAFMGVGKTGDDCLALNIWRPITSPSPSSQKPSPSSSQKRLPVMVWIHGGGFSVGGSHQALYEASTLARENQVIVVSVNYRLGILGFGDWSAWPELGGVTNAGLRDQILALQWVQDCIADFGGDPSRVTLFGESAGGMSIACLMASPKAKGLFHRAIIQSGSPDHVVVKSEAKRITARFAEAAGDVKACLEGDLKPLIKAQRACFATTVDRGVHPHPVRQFGMTLLPQIGDDILPEHPLHAFTKGVSADIPVILGTTRDEWTLFYLSPQTLGGGKQRPEPDAERLTHEFERTLPEQGLQMLSAFQKLMPNAQSSEIFCAYETDRMFRIPTIRMAEARFKAAAPTWHYLFEWPCAWNKRLGSCHTMEIPFVFGIIDQPTGQFFTGGGDEARHLSQQVRAAWTAFAAGQAPQAEGWPAWSCYSEKGRESLTIAKVTRREDNPEADRRALWQEIL